MALVVTRFRLSKGCKSRSAYLHGTKAKVWCSTSVGILLARSGDYPIQGGAMFALARSGGHDVNILFVDDDKDTRELFSLVFSLVGHQVELAGDAQEALRLLGQSNFDVTVVDYFMPGINGLEMVSLFNRTKAQRPTCFILFTRAYQGDLNQEAKELGVFCLVHKPVMPSQLVEAVEKAALERR